jgi:hypothetical protein
MSETRLDKSHVVPLSDMFDRFIKDESHPHQFPPLELQALQRAMDILANRHAGYKTKYFPAFGSVVLMKDSIGCGVPETHVQLLGLDEWVFDVRQQREGCTHTAYCEDHKVLPIRNIPRDLVPNLLLNVELVMADAKKKSQKKKKTNEGSGGYHKTPAFMHKVHIGRLPSLHMHPYNSTTYTHT